MRRRDLLAAGALAALGLGNSAYQGASNMSNSTASASIIDLLRKGYTTQARREFLATIKANSDDANGLYKLLHHYYFRSRSDYSEFAFNSFKLGELLNTQGTQLKVSDLLDPAKPAVKYLQKVVAYITDPETKNQESLTYQFGEHGRLFNPCDDSSLKTALLVAKDDPISSYRQLTKIIIDRYKSYSSGENKPELVFAMLFIVGCLLDPAKVKKFPGEEVSATPGDGMCSENLGQRRLVEALARAVV